MRTMNLLPIACLLLLPATACIDEAQVAEQESSAAGSASTGGREAASETGGAAGSDPAKAGASDPAKAGAGGGASSCPPAPDSATPGAYPTTFRLRAPHGKTLHVRQTCVFEYKLSACEDDYSTELVDPTCYAECNGQDTMCRGCGGGVCATEAITVTDTVGLDLTWGGEIYEIQRSGGTGTSLCSCYVRHPLTPGRYRMELPVYSSRQDALDDVPAFTARQDVDIIAPNAVITVTLQQ